MIIRAGLSEFRGRVAVASAHFTAALVLLVAVGSADARVRSLGDTTGILLSDGERYVVTEPRAGVFKVSDLMNGTDKSYSLACGAIGMGQGSPLLLSCEQTPQGSIFYALLPPRSGKLRPISADGIPGAFDAIGSYWLHGLTPCATSSSGQCDIYRDWRNGRQVVTESDYLSGNDGQARGRDLDDKELRELPVGEFIGGFQRAGRWLLHYTSDASRMLLERRGRRLASVTNTGGPAALSSTAAIWSTSNAFSVRPLNAKHTFVKRLSSSSLTPPPIVQVGNRIVYGQPPAGADVRSTRRVRSVSLRYVRRHWR